MEPRRDRFDLTAELRALRPTPRPEFVADLDAHAAAGFSREDDTAASAFDGLAKWLRAAPPRRLLAPAGALMLSAIAIATAVIATSDEQRTSLISSGPVGQGALSSSGASSEKLVPFAHATNGKSGDSSGDSLPQYSDSARRLQAGSAQPHTAASARAAGEMQLSEAPALLSQARHRQVERDAQIVLGADPADVRSDAAKVFDAVHAADGIVLRSSISEGAAGEAGATFRLLIPTPRLSDALAALSAIDEVRLRHESSQDITAPTVGVGERLQDSRARIEGLLAQLAQATTTEERAAVEVELRTERRHRAALRSRLATLRRRANLTHVLLRIETGEQKTSGEDNGAWGVKDGLDDAGRILGIAAGVTVIALAVIAPLSLILLLTWLLRRAWLRRERAQALA